jgi:hypothetical protein
MFGSKNMTKERRYSVKRELRDEKTGTLGYLRLKFALDSGESRSRRFPTR